jgi:hypothetical protein
MLKNRGSHARLRRPRLQYDTTINDWHTCANTDRIYASNPVLGVRVFG